MPNRPVPGIFIQAMKNRIGVIVLALVCIGLGIALIAIKKQASEQQHQDADKIDALSNNWTQTRAKLDEQTQVAAMLEKDIEGQRKAFGELTNNFSLVSANLSETSSKLTQTATALEASQKEVAKREAKITELETQNQQLDKQALDLSTAITNLTVQINDTQRKLAASEGDKAFLEKELKRLKADKAELERQFNDLTVLRAQVAKLKEELNLARRIEWIRQGLFANSDQKGAQKLMQGLTPAHTAPAQVPKPAYDLNVEVNADGSVKVIPPVQTNSPAAK